VLSVGSILVAAAYTTTRQSRAADQIRELSGLGAHLTKAASQAQAGVLTAAQSAELESRLADLQRRMKDSREPGLVQAELMSSARRAGLEVREVQPMNLPQKGSGQDGRTLYPAYRVSVEGRYTQIAQSLADCRRQQLPARAAAFRLGPVAEDDGGTSPASAEAPRTAPRLRAEITMEVFVPPPSAKTAQEGA